MLDIRKRLFVFIGIGIGILLAAVLFILSDRKINIPKPQIFSSEPKVVPVEEFVPSAPIQNISPNPVSAPVAPAVNASELYAKQLARLFVERYGTYSNQNESVNIEDAQKMATDRMVKWLNSKIKPGGAVYTGVTTKVMASSVESITDSKAVIHFDTQQQFTGSATGSAQKSGKVELLKVDGSWKVDGIYWE